MGAGNRKDEIAGERYTFLSRNFLIFESSFRNYVCLAGKPQLYRLPSDLFKQVEYPPIIINKTQRMKHIITCLLFVFTAVDFFPQQEFRLRGLLKNFYDLLSLPAYFIANLVSTRVIL
ncbi:MAG: hypothetical protein ABJA71_17445 [Ginsengibacter sp.]